MTKIEDVAAPIGAGCRSTELGEHDRIPTAVKRILVPTDPTTESERAIEFGFVLAKLFGAHLTLLHVYKEPYAVQYLRGPYACDAVLQERMHFESNFEFDCRRSEKAIRRLQYRVPCRRAVRRNCKIGKRTRHRPNRNLDTSL
jgi:Universal stress protein family